MANFLPQAADNSPERCRLLSVAVNKCLRGETANIGRVVCAAGQASVTVKDKRCRASRLAILIPMNSVAAGLVWWMDSMTRDEMTFKFTSAPGGEAVFGWVILGDGIEV